MPRASTASVATSNAAASVCVDDRVFVSKTHELGVVRFAGLTEFQTGEWVGVELDKPVGKNDGEVMGVRYFQCKPQHGIFLRASAVAKIDRATARSSSAEASAKGTLPLFVPLAEDGDADSTFFSPRGMPPANRRRSSRFMNLKRRSSSCPDAEIVCGIDQAPVIFGSEGPVDIDDLIQAFGECQDELEGVQTLLEEANNREQKLSAELAQARQTTTQAEGLPSDTPAAALTGGLPTAPPRPPNGVDDSNGYGCNEMVFFGYLLRGGQWTHARTCSSEESKRMSELLRRTDTPDAAERPRRTMSLRRCNKSVDLERLESKMRTLKSKANIIKERMGKLRRCETKAGGDILQSDIELLVKLYTSHNGSLDKLAEVCAVSPELLNRQPPNDSTDFAKKLLKGCYCGDQLEIVKADLRKRLREDVNIKVNSLRHTSTRELNGALDDKDVGLIAAVYNKHHGDLDQLAKLCGLSAEFLHARQPSGAEDFARKLLEGAYTGDGSECSQMLSRDQLREKLQRKTTELRRTVTKESTGAAATDDVQMVARLYARAEGNLEKLAEACGANATLLHRFPPANAQDFAKNLLEGVYTGHKGEEMKTRLRKLLREDVNATIGILKRTETKCIDGEVLDDDVQQFSQIFSKHRGSLEEIASAYGIGIELLRHDEPEDAADFARKLLEGCYTTDHREMVKSLLRLRLREDLSAQLPVLRRSETKCGGGEPTLDELVLIGKIFTETRGDLQRIASAVGADAALLEKRPPQDAVDFAKRLLEGSYSVDGPGAAKATLRKRLQENLLGRMSTLRRTETNKSSGEFQPKDVEAIARIYTQHRGNLGRLAAVFCTDLDIIKRLPPTDAEDFAEKLLGGCYAGDKHEMAKAQLRLALREGIARQSSQLKRVLSGHAEGQGKAPTSHAEDLERAEELYEECQGNPAKLAAACGGRGVLDELCFSVDPPADAQDFALKLFAGAYASDRSELAKALLRKRLRTDLQSQGQALRRTVTRELSLAAAPSDRELDTAVDVYNQYKGDLRELASCCSLKQDLLTERPPADAKDFARRLFEGAYDGEGNDIVKVFFRQGLTEGLQKSATALKRCSTKTLSGKPNDSDVAAFARIYSECRGNLVAIAKNAGVSLALLHMAPPSDGHDFAQKLLEGFYTADTEEFAKAQFRNSLTSDVVASRGSQLKRTNTKTSNGDAIQADLECFSSLFAENEGDLNWIAVDLDIEPAVLLANRPRDAEDFARKLLEGAYSVDPQALAQRQFRQELSRQLNASSSRLRRAETRELIGAPSADELVFFAKLYDHHAGDPRGLAEACSLQVELLYAKPPQCSADFAKKLFMGSYSGDVGELAKTRLRQRLRFELLQGAKALKRASTKDCLAAPSARDVEALAKVFAQCRGNLEAAAYKLHLDIELLKARPPVDAHDFARNVLAGAYTRGGTHEADETW